MVRFQAATNGGLSLPITIARAYIWWPIPASAGTHTWYIYLCHTDTKWSFKKEKRKSRGVRHPSVSSVRPWVSHKRTLMAVCTRWKSEMEVGTGGTRVCRLEGWGLQNGCKNHRPLVSEQTGWCWYGMCIMLSWLVLILQVLELSAAYLSVFSQHSSMYHRAVGVTMVLSEVAGGRHRHGRAPCFPEGRWKVLLFAELITAHQN